MTAREPLGSPRHQWAIEPSSLTYICVGTIAAYGIQVMVKQGFEAKD